MKKKMQYIIKSGWMCLLLALSACGQEEMVPDLQGGGEEMFSLRPVVEPMGGSVGTRTAETPPVIDEYTVLVYQKKGAGTPGENTLVMKEEQNGDGALQFKVEQAKGEHYIYVFANARAKFSNFQIGASTEQNLLDIQITDNQNNSVPLSKILSSSKIILPNLSVTEFNKVTQEGVVPLKRIVAKMTIHFSVGSTVFKPQSVTYVEMSSGTYLAEGRNVIPVNYLPDVVRENGTWENPMYLYEQASKRNGNGSAWKDPGFFLILEGAYKNEGTQYFKFAFPGIATTFGDIERNMSYILDIEKIGSRGYSTLTAAKDPNALFNNIIVSIKPDMTGMENFKEVYTNGYYMLGINSSEFHFYHTFDYGKPYLLTEINCKFMGGSVLQEKPVLSDNSPQLSIVSMDANAQGVKAYLLLTLSVADFPLSGTVKTYKGILAYGNLRKPITVEVHPAIGSTLNTSMKFPASNGSVKKFSYQNVNLGNGTTYSNPELDTGWSWASSDWCGLMGNSQFDVSRYFGTIAASRNDNIFIHVRLTAMPALTAGLRKVDLVADDHLIDVRIGRVQGSN